MNANNLIIVLIAIFFTYPSLAQDRPTFICSSSYSKQSYVDPEFEILSSSSDKIKSYRLTLDEANDPISAIVLENLSETSTEGFICLKRSEYPMLKDPPITYSCASNSSQLFFNSTSGILFIFSPLTATFSLPMIPIVKAECVKS